MERKHGYVDQIEWLESPDFEEMSGKYKLDLNSNSFNSTSTKSKIKCLVIAENLDQFNRCLPSSSSPLSFEGKSPKVLELVYTSTEEEMWLHYRGNYKMSS